MAKRRISMLIFVVLVGFLFFTNPTEKDYHLYSEKKYGKPPTLNLPTELERVNFIIFSTYTPKFAFENGITHLGIMGHFFQISDGQFDYPWWLEFFN